MSWLLTFIEQRQSNGTATSTTETGGTSDSNKTLSGRTDSSTRTMEVISSGERVSSSVIVANGVNSQKSHHAMTLHIEIPIHNKQPIAGS